MVDVVDVVERGRGRWAAAAGSTEVAAAWSRCPRLPKMADSGLPEISSMAVMNSEGQHEDDGDRRRRWLSRRIGARRRPAGPAGRIGSGGGSHALRGGGVGRGRDLQALVSATGAADDSICDRLGAPPSPRADRPTTCGRAPLAPTRPTSPLAPVPPSLRSSVDVSGARTTTCFTAS